VSTLDSLLIDDLRECYRSARFTPRDVMDRLLQASDRVSGHNIWVTRFSRSQVMGYVEKIEKLSIEDLPLYGIPFVIKDNIDLCGVPTTAGCPAFSYQPKSSATVVQKLLDAGAIPLGKTNLDQFATGLVGARSPYGACRNSFNTEFISGGSSAGSAVAVALGLASFSLGTDTAGSGRVPAAFNNIIGLKPSIGRISTQGVVPACRSLDCVSIFSLTAGDAASVLAIAEGFDPGDAYSRAVRDRGLGGMRFGVPRPDQLQFFGDADYSRVFAETVRRAEQLGGTPVEIDFAPFLEAARLLYEGPWVAERFAAIGDFLQAHPDEVLPVTRQIIAAGRNISATAAFQGQYRLMELKRASESVWSCIDVIMTPTAPTIYSIAAVEAEPVRLNAKLGYYTNFMNLLDLAGVALPAGFRGDGMPCGVTLVGPQGTDRALLSIADRLHRAGTNTLGALGQPMLSAAAGAVMLLPGHIPLAVCGAHMQGLPLNHQLRSRGAYLLRRSRTAASYRLFALPGGPPHRPGLVQVSQQGSAIELEVWAVPEEQLGTFVAGIPAPLGIGKILLQDGSVSSGFICENYATAGALDITSFGGWRAYQGSIT
jgi:allophanate hydrolase